MSRRHLHIAPEVAQALPAAHLAQLDAEVDDRDNRCPCCGQFVTGKIAAAVILRDDNYSRACLAHPECASSGIYQWPGLRAVMAELTKDGADITTSVGRRPCPAPHALVLIELLMHVSLISPGGDLSDTTDPLADYAATLGLEPISGQLDQITPAQTATSHLHVETDTLWLIHPAGQDIILDQDPGTLAAWSQTVLADHATAIIITARGLGLTQQPPTISEALATRPAFAAQITVTGLTPRRRWQSLILRRRRAQ
jgi:hypothetical protein